VHAFDSVLIASCRRLSSTRSLGQPLPHRVSRLAGIAVTCLRAHTHSAWCACVRVTITPCDTMSSCRPTCVESEERSFTATQCNKAIENVREAIPVSPMFRTHCPRALSRAHYKGADLSNRLVNCWAPVYSLQTHFWARANELLRDRTKLHRLQCVHRISEQGGLSTGPISWPRARQRLHSQACGLSVHCVARRSFLCVLVSFILLSTRPHICEKKIARVCVCRRSSIWMLAVHAVCAV
jgi:hypothetical protein